MSVMKKIQIALVYGFIIMVGSSCNQATVFNLDVDCNTDNFEVMIAATSVDHGYIIEGDTAVLIASLIDKTTNNQVECDFIWSMDGNKVYDSDTIVIPNYSVSMNGNYLVEAKKESSYCLFNKTLPIANTPVIKPCLSFMNAMTWLSSIAFFDSIVCSYGLDSSFFINAVTKDKYIKAEFKFPKGTFSAKDKIYDLKKVSVDLNDVELKITDHKIEYYPNPVKYPNTYNSDKLYVSHDSGKINIYFCKVIIDPNSYDLKNVDCWIQCKY
jgi:hypothetical protein